jgi:hypothetical protein
MTPTTNAFAGLPPSAESHFRLFYYAAVFHIISYLQRLASVMGTLYNTPSHSYTFLKGYEKELRGCMPVGLTEEDALLWWWEQIREWEESARVRLPLRELARHTGLSYQEQLALVLAGIVEEDIRFGALFAALQEPLPARRPCLGLIGALVGEANQGSRMGDWWGATHRLMEAGLVVAENQIAPRSEWVLRVPAHVWDIIRGRTLTRLSADCTLHSKREFLPLKELVLEDALRQRLHGLPSAIARGQLSAVILRGMADSGRRTIMGALARALRRDLLFCDRSTQSQTSAESWQTVGPLATLTGAFPVVALDPAPGETIELMPLNGYDGAIGIVMRREGGVSGTPLERAITLTLPAPQADHRESIWRRTLGAHAGDELDTIVNRFLLPLGNVQRAASIASSYALVERREKVTASDVQLACRSLGQQKLDTLAQRLEVSGGWSDLVVNEATAEELYELEHRCRHRERLLKHLGAGFRNSVNCGVRALFNGPSGTGKTLAARILAAVLQADLYRVDLAAVVNKYIGETEKNLSQLLARAEELDVVLLVDEGDALMTNRTDVKSANDRYANLETNYLLQRLESYQGIVIVTTNAGNRIDKAFQRRFDVLVDFQPPDPRERLLIWQHHLPASHGVGIALLEEVAQHCALTGGQIRNASLHASLLAVEAGRDGQLSNLDLEQAVQREYRKSGASYPIQRPAVRNGSHNGLSQFLAEVH